MPLCLDQTDSRLVFTFSASIKLPSNVYKGGGENENTFSWSFLDGFHSRQQADATWVSVQWDDPGAGNTHSLPPLPPHAEHSGPDSGMSPCMLPST